jgi:O-antigen biosynthesis protein WbqP
MMEQTEVNGSIGSMYRRYFKRTLDVVFALFALIALSPLILLTAMAIYLEDRGRIFFRQQRVGRGGELFEIWKFRSMPMNSKNVPKAEANSLKITRVGKIIRRANIDELPQLINVLQGDMSIVGPRPPLPAQENLCEMRKQNGAIDCLPGLTGMAQVNAYEGITDEEKAGFDGEYAEGMSFFLDCKIILKTLAFMTRKPPVY